MVNMKRQMNQFKKLLGSSLIACAMLLMSQQAGVYGWENHPIEDVDIKGWENHPIKDVDTKGWENHPINSSK